MPILARPWRRPIAALAVALAFGAPAGAQGGPAAPVAMVAEAVSPRVHVVVGQAGAANAANQGFMSNAGFVLTDEGVVVFDALGTPSLAEQLIGRIREKTAAPIRRVIVSHFHPDHFYGLAPFKAAGAEIWAQRAGAAYLASPAARERLAERRRTLTPWLDDTGDFVTPDRYLDAETSFTLGRVRFRLLHVGPAHTAEDLVMVVEEEDGKAGVLFAGDVVFAGRLPFLGTSDGAAWLTAIDRLIGLRPRVVVGGHGRPAANAEEALRFTRDYLAHLRRTMGEAVAGLVPFDEAYAAADWSAYRQLPLFDETNRINAYNTYLQMEREALQGGR